MEIALTNDMFAMMLMIVKMEVTRPTAIAIDIVMKQLNSPVEMASASGRIILVTGLMTVVTEVMKTTAVRNAYNLLNTLSLVTSNIFLSFTYSNQRTTKMRYQRL